MAGGVLPCELAALVVVVLPRLATPAFFGLLPQPLRARAPLAINTMIREARRRASGTGGLGGLSMTLVITKALLQERDSGQSASRCVAVPQNDSHVPGDPQPELRLR